MSDWPYSIKDNYLAGFGAVIGTVFSIGIAYLIYRYKYRKEHLLAKNALMERILFNDDRAVQMLHIFSVGRCPNFPLDTTGIIIWLGRSADILSSDAINEVNWHRYQLDHVNMKLSALYQIISERGFAAYRIKRVRKMRNSICDHLEEIHKGRTRLLELLEKK